MIPTACNTSLFRRYFLSNSAKQGNKVLKHVVFIRTKRCGNKKFWRIYRRRIVSHLPPPSPFLKEKRFNFSSSWFPVTCYGQFALPVFKELNVVCNLRTLFVCNQWPLYDSFKSFLNRDILKLQQAETLFAQKALLLLLRAQTSFCLVFLISRRGSDQFLSPGSCVSRDIWKTYSRQCWDS